MNDYQSNFSFGKHQTHHSSCHLGGDMAFKEDGELLEFDNDFPLKQGLDLLESLIENKEGYIGHQEYLNHFPDSLDFFDIKHKVMVRPEIDVVDLSTSQGTHFIQTMKFREVKRKKIFKIVKTNRATKAQQKLAVKAKNIHFINYFISMALKDQANKNRKRLLKYFCPKVKQNYSKEHLEKFYRTPILQFLMGLYSKETNCAVILNLLTKNLKIGKCNLSKEHTFKDFYLGNNVNALFIEAKLKKKPTWGSYYENNIFELIKDIFPRKLPPKSLIIRTEKTRQTKSKKLMEEQASLIRTQNRIARRNHEIRAEDFETDSEMLQLYLA